jgi:hypothetical protein
VSDRSLDEFGKLKNLSYLEIQYTRVNAAAVERLQELLPHASIRK